MADFPAQSMAWLDTGNVISSVGLHGVGGLNGGQPIPTAQNGTANRAYYVPVRILSPITITQMGWHNGTGVAGNIDVGIYNPDGVALVTSGAQANSGVTSVMQWVNITDTRLNPGLVYFALSASSAIMSMHRLNVSLYAAMIMGMMVQATAHPLPTTTATFAANLSGAWPLIVASQGAVV